MRIATGSDYQDEVGQDCALILGLAQLLTVLAPVGENGITLIRHEDPGSPAHPMGCHPAWYV
jgi:hypothetical protein